jgi:hypothetical protein
MHALRRERGRAEHVLVLTLLVRDEADVVGATIDFHLGAGVDFVIATDHRSVDGSREILERYERDGVLRLVREDGEPFDSRAFRTRMARMAAAEYGADWVIGADADEFFWPRGGSLPEVLAAVPERFGVVRAPWRFFVPRPDGDAFFAERMTARLSPTAWLAQPRSAYKPDVKIVHRGHPDVLVQGGNHRLLSGGLAVAPWHPIEVLHFPVRSVAQLERKLAHWSRAGRIWVPGRADVADAQSWFEWVAVTDDVLESGLADGSLTVDTRLRDTLRLLRDSGSRPGWESEEDGAYRAALGALGDRALHQLLRRLDDAEQRVAGLESAGVRDGVG